MIIKQLNACRFQPHPQTTRLIWNGAADTTSRCIKIRVVVDFNAAVLLGLALVIHRLVNFNFHFVVLQELEVLPDLVLVPGALRHDVRNFVQRNEHERVGINERVPPFLVVFRHNASFSPLFSL